MPFICFCIALSVSVKLYWWVNHVSFWSPYTHPLGALDVLAIGGLLAYFYKYYHDTLQAYLHNPPVTLFVFAQFFLCLLCKEINGVQAIFHVGIRVSYGIFCAWIIGRSVFGFTGAAGYLLNNRALQYVGKISYSFYLFHPFVGEMLCKINLPQSPNIRFVIYFTVTLILSTASWYLFEKPILRLKNRFE